MTEHDAKIWNHHARCVFLDELDHARTRQGRFEKAMLHFDHPLPGGGRFLEPSDNGKGAADIRAGAGEVEPLWLHLWRNARIKLPPKGKRILDALEQDWRNRPAARIAGVDHETVARWKTFFKMHFAQCHKAYHAFLDAA